MLIEQYNVQQEIEEWYQDCYVSNVSIPFFATGWSWNEFRNVSGIGRGWHLNGIDSTGKEVFIYLLENEWTEEEKLEALFEIDEWK